MRRAARDLDFTRCRARRDHPPLSIMAIITPLLFAGIMVAYLNPIYAVFTVLSPTMAIGTWLELRWRTGQATSTAGSVAARGRRDHPPLSIMAIITPLLFAGIMVVCFGPIYALFAVLSPTMAIGTWLESRWRVRQATSTSSSAARGVSAVAADGARPMPSRATRGLVALAVWLLPVAQRLRYREEFGVELGELPRWARWRYALRVLVSAWELREALVEAVRTSDGESARRAER
jgi:hypothetical protein